MIFFNYKEVVFTAWVSEEEENDVLLCFDGECWLVLFSGETLPRDFTLSSGRASSHRVSSRMLCCPRH